MTRGVIVWLLIMLAATVHGVLRGILLVPYSGEAAASRIGWPIGAIIVLGIATLCIRWTGIAGSGPLLRLGLTWALLTFVFEGLIGLLRGLAAPDIAAELNPLAGGLMLYSLILMGFAPLIASRLRRLVESP